MALHRSALSGEVLLAVALGGALGGGVRYAVGLGLDAPSEVPWATVAVNVVGCALMGVLIAGITARHPQHADHPRRRIRLARPLLGTGFLGGFTTFSAYAVDVVDLATDPGDAAGIAGAAAYLILLPVLSLAAYVLGHRAMTSTVGHSR